MKRLSPLVLSTLVALQPLAPASALGLFPAAAADPAGPSRLRAQAATDDSEEERRRKRREQREQERQQQERELRQRERQRQERQQQERQQQEREIRQQERQRQERLERERREQERQQQERQERQRQKEKDERQYYKQKYEQKYENRYRRDLERARYAPGYRPAPRYAWSGWDRNRWYNYNRYPTWSPWVRPVAYGAYNPFPVWAQPGWYNSRPWNTGWYGGWSSPPWGWWGGQSIAWGIAGLATTALINGLIDNAVQQRQPVIVVPSSNWQLMFGTVEPNAIGQVTFVASNGVGSYRLTADCNEGLLDGQVPFQAAQAQLVNAACQVAYGSYTQAGYGNSGYGNPGYGNPGYYRQPGVYVTPGSGVIY
jgi:hypothetical protein